VIEAVGRAGIADSLSGGDVPFYDRYYLGGLYSLRGFKYRNIAPRDPNYYPNVPVWHGPNEPIGGDSYWFGSVEYSLPIFEKDNGPGVRFALFYDVGSVGAGFYSFSGNFDDNWGVGLHINIPKLGPLRLEYGVPIHHDQYNGSPANSNSGSAITANFKMNRCLKKSCRRSSTAWRWVCWRCRPRRLNPQPCRPTCPFSLTHPGKPIHPVHCFRLHKFWRPASFQLASSMNFAFIFP
jgi:hypothetical protein